MTIPREMAERPQWMLWKSEYGTKVPYAIDGKRGKANDSATWSTLAEVSERAGQEYGTAWVFCESDDLCGIDLDGCIDGGKWDPWAAEIRDKLKGVAYGEISPSCTGVKFTTRAAKPAASRCKNGGVECYDNRRFWTVTENCLGKGFDKIGDGQAAVDWLIEKHLQAPERPTAATRGLSGAGGSFELLSRAEAYTDSVPAGQKGGLRNGAFSLAGHLHSLLGDDGERLSDTDVYNCLKRWNLASGNQLRDDELRESAVNGRKNGTPPADKPAKKQEFNDHPDVDLSGLLGKIVAETPPDVPFSPGDFPRAAIPDFGIIGELMELNLATSMFPQPELALAGALAAVATVTGRKVEDSHGTRTNVYLLGLGLSGAGKEHARKINKRLFNETGASEMMGPERIGSSAGLTTAVKEKLAILLQIDEIGHMLATMKNPGKSAHLFNIATVLMQMYSSADSIWVGDAYAESKKTPTINQPHCVLYGTTTPGGFWINLSSDAVENGLLGRMMVFESPGRVTRQRGKRLVFPQKLLDDVRWWVDLKPGGVDPSISSPLLIEHEKEALERFEEHVDGICERQDAESDSSAALWSRTGEKTAKLAMLFACSRQPRQKEMTINLDDVDRAVLISNWLTRRMLRQAHEFVATNQVEDDKKRFLRAVSGEMTLRDIGRKTQWLRPKQRHEVLCELEEMGLLRVEMVDTGGRKATIIRRI